MKPASLISEFLGTALLTYSFNCGSQSLVLRGYAYFLGFMLFFKVSGALFNPALTLARFCCAKTEPKNCRNFVNKVLLIWLAQLLGSFFGIFIVYLLIKDYGKYRLLPQDLSPGKIYVDKEGYPYWARLVSQEALQSMSFFIVYLVVTLDKNMQKVDQILKGLSISIALAVCCGLTLGSGGCLNPAIGLTQSIYMIGLDNRNKATLGNDEAKYIWVYAVSPFLGTLFSSLLYLLHLKILSTEDKQ